MATDKTELRQLIPTALGSALDGIAMADGLDRCQYIQQVLENDVRKRAHAAMVIARVLRGNPYCSEGDGSASQ